MMPKSPSTTVLVLAGLLASGCASSPWSTRTSSPISVPQSAHSSAGSATSAQSDLSDPQKIQDVIADLRKTGEIDPAAEDQLLGQLHESDPSLWPLVVQQFRATAAYRRRAKRVAATGRAQRLPPVDEVAVVPIEAPQEQCPSVFDPPTETLPPPSQASGQVTQASYVAPVADDWRQHLATAIATLEVQAPPNPSTPADVADHARLRMLYAAAGRRADAVRPIPSPSPTEQQFLAKELDGLTTWLDAEQIPETARRATEAKPALAEALGKLAESAPLVVCNLAFCTEVRSYGCAARFEKYEFQPNQETLLYAEVENFASESTPKGYHTSLRSTYQILDEQGQRVVEHAFAPTEEHCQNIRRDYFIGYHLRLPKALGPGKYSLRLSIEDLQCHKVGQASIEFAVKKEGKEPQISADKR